jgi:single-stranded-DNA-specific exonuclease
MKKHEIMSRISNLNKLLPLVAIGTVADCQSIIDQTNRLLVKSGLQILQSKKHDIVGLHELIKQTGLYKKMEAGYKLNSQDLGYTLSPILNSSGRISHARLSISTLIAESSDALITENQEFRDLSVEDLAGRLIATNQERKQVVKDILHEVESEAKSQYESGQRVLWLEGAWSKGIVGLLASRLVNEYNLPVVVVSTIESEE